MRKSTKVAVLTAVWLAGTLPSLAFAYSGDKQLKATAPGTSAQSYELKEFSSDFKMYKIGDIAPEIYRSEPYNIKSWQLRHLPAPQAGSHWTYMGGNYVLITDAEGKILQAMAGDIFYQH